MEPLDDLKYIHDKIERYEPTDSANELKKLVTHAIDITEKLSSDKNLQNFELLRNGLVRDLKHTLEQEVKLFDSAKLVRDKKSQLRSAILNLTRDIDAFLKQVS